MAASAARQGAYTPSLVPYTVIPDALSTADMASVYLLASGDEHLSMLPASSGALDMTQEFTEAPMVEPIVVDVNSDGVNDILILSAHGLTW